MPRTAIHPGEHLAEELKELGMRPRSLRGSLTFRPTALHPELRRVEGGSPGREIKAWQDKDRAIQVTVDGKVLFVVNYNGLSAAIYRLHLDSGDRQLVKTLGMRDSTGGFGVTRVVTTPDGQYFAYNTLRQLSELYLLQGLY
jgi:hypothetical protein